MIKIKYYIYTIITILAVSGSSAVYALDTTETFDVGLVTNFEAYYALSFSDKKSH